MNKFVLSIICILMVSMSYGQSKWFLGFETGFKGDLHSVQGDDSELSSPVAPGIFKGVTIGRTFHEKWLMETGVSYLAYSGGATFDEIAYTQYFDMLNAIQIPIRLKRTVFLIPNRMSITPSVGANLLYNLDYNSLSGGGGMMGLYNEEGELESASFEYSYVSHTRYHRIFPMLEAGLSVDYKFSGGLELFLQSRYQAGFSKLLKYDVAYAKDVGPQKTATFSSRGNQYHILAGIRYPISNFWQNDEVILKKRKERKIGIQEQLDSKYYIAVENGITWNRFHNSNAAITGNEDVANIFWDNDYIIGVNLGYMVNPRWSVEVGAYNHMFTNRYYVTHDNAVVGGIGYRSGGSGILQIPVSAKYFHRVWKDRLAIVPHVGVSLLTHFKEVGAYSQIVDEDFDFNNGEFNVLDTLSIATAYRPRKVGCQIHAGVGLEYALAKHCILTLHGNYNVGLLRMNRLVVSTEYNGEAQQGHIDYRGTNFTLQAGIKIPI